MPIFRRCAGALVVALLLVAPASAFDLQSTTVPGRTVPTLTNGEIAINRADKRLIFKNVDGSLGYGSLLNALASGRKAVEQGDGSDLTTLAQGGSVTRAASARVLDMGRNVRDFGAVCDGATDNGPAFRAAAAVARVVRYDLEGCQSFYQINTTVTLPTGVSVVGPTDGFGSPLGIRTSASVDTFVAGGDQYGIVNTRIQHDGASGMAINGKSALYGTIANNAITGTVSGNTSPLVQTSGSLVSIDKTAFTNNRVNAYSVTIDGQGTSSPIVHRLISNTFGGAGKGISIGNTSGTARPEGIYLTNNHCFVSNVCLLITSVNDLRSVGNTWDIGSGSQVVLAGAAQGIDLVSFTDDYFSTLDNTQSPAATRPAGVCLQIGGAVARITVRSKFAYCGYGIASTDGGASKLTIGSSFLNVANIALNLQNVKGLTLAGNTCDACAYNFILADGAGGGPIIVSDNQWDPAGAIGITQTNPTNFRFGQGNTGVKLAGYASASVSFSTTGCLSVQVQHGLPTTPNLNKITLSPGVASGTLSNLSATVTGADATNITAQVCATVTAAGTARVVANASL